MSARLSGKKVLKKKLKVIIIELLGRNLNKKYNLGGHEKWILWELRT